MRSGFLFFDIPIPVVVKEGEKEIDGYAIYVEGGGQFENDIWCIVHCDGGIVRHYRTDQLVVHKNATFDIKPKQDEK